MLFESFETFLFYTLYIAVRTAWELILFLVYNYVLDLGRQNIFDWDSFRFAFSNVS